MEKNDTYRSVLHKLDTKIYGTTVYIGRTEVTTIYGNFTCFTFQDLIHKGYIIALCHGDLAADTLYTRMHSSCVTSETMRSLDCDCVSQLYGALKKIAENNGILFYLIQEGRGCGYVGKSRACMNVQFYEDTEDEINTFQAYEQLGMVHDYRQYNNVKEILTLMGINPTFVLLTNNPDKIEKFKNLEIHLDRVESIEISPNPFNQQYLHSKEKYGHILYQAKTKVSKYMIPHQKIEPFDPYPLDNAKRFIHVSSYYLPIKPTWQKVLLNSEEYSILKKKYPDHDFPYQILDNDTYYVKLTEQIINDNSELLCKPYWFKVNVFYDIVTHHDYLILEYGMDNDNSKVPIIRIHSESIFNRFPLTDRLYKYRYKRSLEYIVRNGKGAILILYHDGRGSGLGYYVLNSKKDERSDLIDSQEFEDTLGVEEDRRDYYGALTLLKTYSLKADQPIDVIHGDSSYATLKSKMEEHHIPVRHWIDVDHQTDLFGYESIYSRICQTPGHLSGVAGTIIQIYHDLQYLVPVNNQKIVVTGIGSSESHAKYLIDSLINTDIDIRYLPLSMIVRSEQVLSNVHLVIFSQGLSYNCLPALRAKGYDSKILVTTYTGGNIKKDQYYDEFINSNQNVVIQYPKEDPDDTLIRITGPLSGYVISEVIGRVLKGSNELMNLSELGIQVEQARGRVKLDYDFISAFDSGTKLTLILPDDIYGFHKDISNRFIEGAFVDTTICKVSEYAHGFYQKSLANSDSNVSLFVKTRNTHMTESLEDLLKSQKTVKIDLTGLKSKLVQVLVLISCLNDAVYQIMQKKNVNQRDWPGKSSQHVMYDVIDNGCMDVVIDELERIRRKYEAKID